MKKVTLENIVERLNAKNGVTAPKWNTIGSYKLYKDGAGYAVHKVINAGGGVAAVGNTYGMTANECYFFLTGLLADNE